MHTGVNVVMTEKIVAESELISQIQSETDDSVALLCDGYAYQFTEVSGGVTDRGLTRLVLVSQTVDVPELHPDVYELHTDDTCYTLNVNNVSVETHIDSGTQIVYLTVHDYQKHDYGFADAMRDEIDNRWEKYSYE